jgi:hypothetical protein
VIERLSIRNRTGVSLLLEVIIGLGVFAASLLIALGVISFSDRASVGARNHAVALNLARATLESELSKVFADIVDDTGNIVIVSERSGVESPTQFDISVDVSPEPPDPERRHVEVTVSWRENNVTKRVSLEGYALNI